MLKNGTLSKPFEESIYSYSLCFIDQKLEDEYMKAKTEFRLITPTAKCFMWTIMFAYVFFIIFDAFSALGGNTKYGYSIACWVSHSLLIPVAIFEIICYVRPSIHEWRGIAISIVGTIVTFFNGFDSFYQTEYYPYIGIGYVFSITLAYLSNSKIAI